MSATSHTAPATTLVSGRAGGPAFVLREPLSFWGGLDSGSGRIIDRWHPQHGESLAGRALVMESGRGSSSGSSVLAEAIRLGTGPVGIVLLTRDAIVTVGAMIAQELYAASCPVVLARIKDWDSIVASGRLTIHARSGEALIGCSIEP